MFLLFALSIPASTILYHRAGKTDPCNWDLQPLSCLSHGTGNICTTGIPRKVHWQTHLLGNEGLYTVRTIQAVQTIHSKSTCLQTLITKHKRREEKMVYFKITSNHELTEQDHQMFSLNIPTHVSTVQAHCAQYIPLTHLITSLHLQHYISKSMH